MFRPSIRSLLLARTPVVTAKKRIIWKFKEVLASVYYATEAYSPPIKLIKELRERTQAGLSDCKAALVETNGDIDKAIQWLLKLGKTRGETKASKIAAEGVVAAASTGSVGALVELNSESDFVARADAFQALAHTLALKALDASINTVEDLTKATITFSSGLSGSSSTTSVTEALSQLTLTLGEKIQLRRLAKLTAATNGVIGKYIHRTSREGVGKLAALVHVAASVAVQDRAGLAGLADTLALQVVGMKPQYIHASDVPASVVDHARQQFLAAHPPDTAKQKGPQFDERLFREERALMSQHYCLAERDDMTVELLLRQEAAKLAAQLTVREFVRFEAGEGIQKQSTDFAAEVQRQAAATPK